MIRVIQRLFVGLLIIIGSIYIDLSPCFGYSGFSESEVQKVVADTVEVYLHNDWGKIDTIDYVLSYNGGEVVLFDPNKKKYIKEKLYDEFEFVSFPGNKKYFKLGTDQKVTVYNLGLDMNKKLSYKIKEITVNNNIADVVLDLNLIRGDIINKNINECTSNNDIVYATYLKNVKNPPLANITLKIQLKKTVNELGGKHYFLTTNNQGTYNKYDNAIFAKLYSLIWYKYNEINYRIIKMPADEYLRQYNKNNK